jgi:two-component system, sporulation sensor kinase E
MFKGSKLKREKFSALSIKGRIMLMVSLVIIFAIITTVGPIMIIQSDQLFASYQEKTEVAALALAETFSKAQKDTTLAAKAAASIPGLVDAVEGRDQEACLRIMSLIIKEREIDFGLVTDEKGVVLVRTYSANKGDDLSGQVTIKQALGGTDVSMVQQIPVSPLGIRSSVPVKNSNGRIIGTVSFSIDGAKAAMVDKTKQIYGVEATIFAGDTRVSTTVTKDGQRATGTKASPDITEMVLKKGADYKGRADVNGIPFVASYKPVKGPDGEPVGMIFSGKSLQSYYEDRNQQLRVVAGLALGNLLVCLLIAYWMAETLYAPLVQGLNRYENENKKLNQLINLCPLGIILYDHKGYVSELNTTYFERIVNFNSADFLGKPGQYLVEAIGFNWENSASYRALKGIETANYYQKNAYGACCLINSVPLRDCENKITGALTIIHDITEYERIKEEMARLDRLNLLGEMAAGVAHEIRNPLTVVKGYLQFLSGKVSDNIVEQFGIALKELERIEQIISDFLSLAGNKLSEHKEQDLNTIIKGVIPLIQTEAHKRGIELEVKTKEIPDLLLNENDIKQLLLNLARNSMEAMSQHGILAIETSVEDDIVCLCISDSGCGIPKELQEKIFTPFFTTKSNGTGLGLAVCAGIVRRHNGTIEVQSEEGKGSKFIITFNRTG